MWVAALRIFAQAVLAYLTELKA
eukprot:COSAG01_NODE_46598_length_398_cov_11.394649_1_plen_22_part_10